MKKSQLWKHHTVRHKSIYKKKVEITKIKLQFMSHILRYKRLITKKLQLQKNKAAIYDIYSHSEI